MQKIINLVSTLVAKVSGLVATMDINKNLNHLAISGCMKFIHIIKLKKYQIIQSLDLLGNAAIVVSYSNNGILIAVSYEYCQILEYRDNCYHQIKVIQDQFFNGPTILKNDMHLISIMGDSNLYIYNINTNQKKKLRISKKNSLQNMAIHKKEELLLVAGEYEVYFFDLKNNRIKKKQPLYLVQQLQISNNVQLYVQETYNSLKIRAIQCHKIIRQFIVEENQFSQCIKFTNKDNFVVLGGSDQKIRILSIKNGNLTICEQDLGIVYICQFYQDQNIEFFCGTENGSIVKWSSI